MAEMMIDDYEAIAEAWNALRTDAERWVFLQTGDGRVLTVWLDNDDTGVRLVPRGSQCSVPSEIRGAVRDIDLKRFREPIGQSPGITTLLEALGIACEYV